MALRRSGQYDEAIAAFEKLGDYSDAEVKIKEIKYQQAMALRRSGQYDEAIAAFTALGNYGDAEMQIKEVKYQQAVELRENGQYDDAIVAFTELKDYSDAKTQIAEMKYQQGKAFLNVMDYDNAARILITIKGYKDVDKLLTENDDIMAISAEIMLDTKFTVGNYVTFGTYPQTALGNDQTPIEWLVLARDGRQALLISRYGLDAKPYNTKLSSTTWGKCTLRTWLNDTFLNKAFSSTEQTAILTTDVDNSKQQCYSGWNPSRENDTKDKVFLLSYAEANKYFGIQYVGTNVASQKARVAPTAYIEGKIYTYNESKTIDGQNAGTWWLRSPGKKSLDASVTTASGMFNSSDVNLVEIVRPALWVSIDSPIFRQ